MDIEFLLESQFLVIIFFPTCIVCVFIIAISDSAIMLEFVFKRDVFDFFIDEKFFLAGFKTFSQKMFCFMFTLSSVWEADGTYMLWLCILFESTTIGLVILLLIFIYYKELVKEICNSS
jgi:hypothetical protein